MKTKITSFLKAAVLSIFALATTSLADEEVGFYEKDHVRGFISIGGEYRGMFDDFQKYVNKTAFLAGTHESAAPGDTVVQTFSGSPTLKYNQFNDYFLGLHVNVGAQYKQFLTWFDFNFMPTQVSERPSKTYSATSTAGDKMNFPLYDVRWFTYGADWMFGWKLFGENTFFNIIPSVGLGFNLINFHLASNFTIYGESTGDNQTVRDRYYSSFASTINTELEIRLEFDPIAIGIYGGYRYIRYNELEVEGINLESSTRTYDTDNCGETFFIGLRLTWIFQSDWQNKQSQKL